MKILKKILVVIAILMAIPLLVALFTTKDYSVEHSVTINKPKQQVFNYVKLLKNQPSYSVWAKKDPNAKMEYKGTDGTVGFVSAWQSDVKGVGAGEQTITNISDGTRMDVALHFLKPVEGKANAFFATDSIGASQTKVTWSMYGKMNYPMNFMLVIVNMDKMLGKELQTGLDNLKDVLEKQ